MERGLRTRAQVQKWRVFHIVAIARAPQQTKEKIIVVQAASQFACNPMGKHGQRTMFDCCQQPIAAISIPISGFRFGSPIRIYYNRDILEVVF